VLGLWFNLGLRTSVSNYGPIRRIGIKRNGVEPVGLYHWHSALFILETYWKQVF